MRARASCTSSTSTARAVGAPVNLDHIRRIGAAVDVPLPGRRRAANDRGGSRSDRGRRDLGRDRNRGLHRRRLPRPCGRRARRSRGGSVDARAGKLAVAGWAEHTDIPLEAVIERLGARGVRRFGYSSIDRDGMLEGPDLDGARRVADAVRGIYAYSGGVSTLEDLQALVGAQAG